ncbi:MAG TPA: Hsp70 family protein [Candidatus Kryptonia bacterium]|nr:Hsp70 family protein [Candidatus Kryptonia bacterium]
MSAARSGAADLRSPTPGPRFIIGVDLGTTNSAVAFVDTADDSRTIRPFAIPQLVSEAQVAAQPALPSFLYLAGEHEIAPGALALPWDAARNFAVGEFARVQGARVPGRLVSSAKSWLCHGGVDRTAKILPYGAPEDVKKISPVDASARYLAHIREAWDHQHPSAPLAQQDVVLTVPASFDEVARELTVAAAEQAGFPKVVLLEEPQAAFYAWLSANETDWQRQLAQTRLVLVVDIGGGTTDFSLIATRDDGRGLVLERVAVGDHLLLGGDNIDIALARLIEPRLGGQLDSQRWHALTNLCRAAKETLLAEDAPAEMPIRLVGRGKSVVGGVLATSLTREEVERTVMDGYFPPIGADAAPRKTPRSGVQEWGLPFALEPEVPRHLAAFLRRHRADGGDAADRRAGELARADAVLFNGGALKPRQIRARLRELLGRWSGDDGWQPAVLESVDLDLAVARGAAYYGLVRRGRGVRIGGGAARSYYLAIGGVTNEQSTVSALCLVHRGMEPGEPIEIAEPAFDVMANQPVSFPLFASSTRSGEHAGQLVQAERDSLAELPPIRTVLRFGRKVGATRIPVHVVTHLTEVGTLEVWCHSQRSEHRWRLQFQLRDVTPLADERPGEERAADLVVSDAQLGAATAVLGAVFPAAGVSHGDPVKLAAALEVALGAAKDAWPLPAIRRLWDTLLAGESQRRTTPAHEARWLNLAGFLLRPGFGHELDPWRVEQLWKLFTVGLRFSKAVQNRAEWWSMWKRVAGGLSRAQQQQLFNEVAPALLPRLKKKLKARVGPQELREYWQLLGSCEQLGADVKAELGDVLIGQIEKGQGGAVALWSLGRLGARAPFNGPLNCVASGKIVTKWVERLLAATALKRETLVFTLVQLARHVDDRERDLEVTLRQRVAESVRDLPGGTRAAKLVTEFVPLEAQERARVLDESLPAGLVIREA